jgi:hypothetical protein
VCLVSPTRESIERFEARKARSLAGLRPAKECLICKVKPFERDLRRLRIETSIRLVGGSQFREIGALIGKPNARPRPLPRRNPLFECGVIQSLMHPEHVRRRRLLRGRRIHAIYGLADHRIHACSIYQFRTRKERSPGGAMRRFTTSQRRETPYGALRRFLVATVLRSNGYVTPRAGEGARLRLRGAVRLTT